MVTAESGLRIVSAAALVVAVSVQDTSLRPVPASLPAGPKSELNITHACISWRIDQYEARRGNSQKKCTNVQPGSSLLSWCTEEFASLDTVEKYLEQQIQTYNDRAESYVRAASAETGTQAVDARVELVYADAVAQVGEIACSTAVTEMRRGFEAVASHDWPLAWAMWASALRKDPDNPAIKRSVDLARFMVDYRKAGGTKTATEIHDGPPPPPSDPEKELHEFLRKKELEDFMRALKLIEPFVRRLDE